MTGLLNVLRQRWKSRTYRATVILAVISGIELSSGLILDWLHVPAHLKPWALMVWPLTMLAMREVTTAALADK